jgi:hypothetical protein
MKSPNKKAFVNEKKASLKQAAKNSSRAKSRAKNQFQSLAPLYSRL